MIKTFHIGPHKTASTYLQHHIFPNIKGVEYLDDGCITGFYKRGVKFSEEGWVFSNEAALGHPYSVTQPPKYEQFLYFCKGIGVTRLIAVRRSYQSWVRSVWFQSLNEYGVTGFSDWYAKNEANLESWRMLYSDLEFLACDRGFELLIVNLSSLQEDPTQVAKEIAEFCGGSFEGKIKHGRLNESAYGRFFISCYLSLNRSIGRIQILRKLLPMLRLSPRAIMQKNIIGRVLSMLSKSETQMPNDLAYKEWL